MKIISTFAIALLGLGSVQAFGSDYGYRDRAPLHGRYDDYRESRCVRYTVLYREHDDDHWHLQGVYSTRDQAEHAAHHLEDSGHHVHITVD